MMYQAVSHTFINNLNVMTNSFQNAMVNAMEEGATTKYSSPCYQQPIPSVADAMVQADAGDPSATEPIWRLYPMELLYSLRHRR